MKSRRRKKIPIFGRLIFSGLVVAGLALGTLACVDQGPIPLGFAGVLSGRNSDLSVDARDALLLAINQKNSSGGIRGRLIELEIADDGNNVDQAVRSDKELASHGVTVIIGHVLSSMTPAVKRVMAEEKVLFISPTMSTTELSRLDDMFLRVSASMDEQSRVLIEQIARVAGEPGSFPIALVYDVFNAVYSQGMAEQIKGHYEAMGGRVVVNTSFDSNTDNYQEIARNIFKSKALGVVLATGSYDAAMIAQQLRKLSPVIKLFAPNWTYSPELIVNGGAAVEGMVIAAQYENPEQSPDRMVFEALFEKTYGRSASFAARYSYECAMILFAAFEKTTDFSARNIRDIILASGTYQGLDGPMSFNRFGDVVRPTAVMSIHNGAFVQESKK